MTILCNLLDKNSFFVLRDRTHSCYERWIDKMCNADDVRGIFFSFIHAAIIKNEFHRFVFSFSLGFSQNAFN